MGSWNVAQWKMPSAIGRMPARCAQTRPGGNFLGSRASLRPEDPLRLLAVEVVADAGDEVTVEGVDEGEASVDRGAARGPGSAHPCEDEHKLAGFFGPSDVVPE